mgnify:CR=1 FL=1
MKVTKSQLRQIIKEEIEKILAEEQAGGNSDYLSNIYKWCPSGTKCAPESQKTKWWKGR